MTIRPPSRIVLAASLTLAANAAAGPLNPPAGPVAPTGKPLVEVEPRRAINAANTPGDANSIFRISEPGSYYLAQNVAGEPGKHGIEIAASGVTIDLSGFDLAGVPGSLDGITVTAPGGASAVSVLNGSVRSWDGDGVDLAAGLPIDGIGAGRVERLRIQACGGVGIRINNHAAVVGCTIVQTGGDGIAMGYACTVSACEIGLSGFGGTGSGIRSEGASTVTGCNIFRPTEHGITSITVMTVERCTIFGAAGDGINVGQRSLVTGCSVGGGAGSGIVVGSRSMVESSLVHANQGNGISIDGTSTVRGCTSVLSGEHGILAGSSCAVLSNLCSGNGTSAAVTGAGIRVAGERSRIEGNTLTSNEIGLELTGPLNIALRNTSSVNATNWTVASLNVCHVLQAVTNPAPFSGNSGGVHPGGTDANVNYTQ